MRRHLHLFILGMFFFSGCARAGVVLTHPSDAEAGITTPVSIAPTQKTVPVGETLEYQIFWWGVLVGEATLSTNLSENKKLIELSFEADSNWYMRFIYPVKVRMTSLIDPASTSPRRFESYLKRQWRVHESVITFDEKEGIARHHLLDEKIVSVKVNPATQDGLSMLYYARTIPLQLGKTVPLEITADGKNWPLKGTVLQAGIVRIGSSGYWPALEGEVELAYPVPFFHGANVHLWFSADQERIPLLAKIRSRIGPVTVALKRRGFDRK